MEGGSAELTRTITIKSCFEWYVTIGSKKIAPSSHQLEGLPSRLSSIPKVKVAVRFFDSCLLCIGNSDEKYTVLVSARKGIFFDASGMYNCISTHF